MSGSGYVIVLLRILLRISHEQVAIDIGNVEWRIAARNFRIGEMAIESPDLGEQSVGSVRPKNIHRAVVEVGREQEGSLRLHTVGQTFVNGAVRRLVSGYDRVVPRIQAAG